MDHRTLLAIVIIVVIVGCGLAVAWWYSQRKRKHLRSQFGPEYNRTVRLMKNQRRAEAELDKREKRVKQLTIHPLSPGEQQRFSADWKNVQARFVDEPGDAVLRAEQLLRQLMLARGYPDRSFEELADDVSVYHPHLVQDYRKAHMIAHRAEAGEADTEELRQAIVNYRALFDDLLRSQRAA